MLRALQRSGEAASGACGSARRVSMGRARHCVRGALSTAEGPRHAVLSCAGEYVPGADGSNECPAGSVRIETEAACRAAAAAAGKTTTSSFVETRSAYPRGCYYYSDNAAYFNTHAVGAGRSSSLLLCAVSTGAQPAQTDARACTPASSAALHACVCAQIVRCVCGGMHAVVHGHVGARTLGALRGAADSMGWCCMATGGMCV